MTGFVGDNHARGRNPFSWAEFDALPAPVRHTINFALTGLGSRRATMNLRGGKSIAEVCAIERAVARGITMRGILDDYGPDHPFVSTRHDA